MRCPGFSALKTVCLPGHASAHLPKRATGRERNNDMKINKKLWSAVLMLALVLTVSLLFTSCKTTPVDPPEQSTTSEEEGTTSAPESPTLEIARDGKLSIARVVRPADIASNAPEIATAKTLRDAINNIMNDDFGLDLAYDEKLAMEEDFLMPGQTYDSSTVEILIGATAYDESAGAFDGLSYGDYAVKAVGNKIIVAAYTESGYNAAANKLIDLIKQSADTTAKSITLGRTDIVIGGSTNKTISAIPMYEGGAFGSYYKAGNTVDEIIVKKTNRDEFDSYLKKLNESGYTCYTTNEIKSNKFATYTNENYTLTVGYYNYEASARLIIEPLAEAVPLEAAKYEKVTTSQITMLGLEYKTSDSYKSNGLSMLIRLEDGSFIIIDGGFNRASCSNNLAAEIRKQASKYAKNDKDIRIAAWIITPAHGDHSGMISSRSDAFKGFTVENFLVNFISDSERQKAISEYIAKGATNWSNGEGGGYASVLSSAENLGAKVRTVHVGQNYYFADAKLEVLYTIESFGPSVCNAFNTTSLIIKATISGTTFMITGDATGNGMQAAVKAFGDYLTSDIVQVSHHGYTTWGNEAGTIAAYRQMVPPTLLWPQGGNAYPKYVSKSYNVALTDTKSNPNYRETYVAGTEGDTVILPLPYKVGTAIVSRVSTSKIEGASTIKK